MPSPFPGMDPYFEGSVWPTLHAQLAAEIVRQLAPVLFPRYFAVMQEYAVRVSPDDIPLTLGHFQPDVSIRERQPWSATPNTLPTFSAPLEMTTLIPEEFVQQNVEIRDRNKRQLVTLFEILSPSNKIGEGRREYLAKRNEILRSTSHLVEIDLLRRGQRVPMERELPPYPYFVFVSRAEVRPRLQVWPISLHQSLPTIRVPLLPGDADVLLDLQAAFTSVYDSCRFDAVLDYGGLLEWPLEPEQELWLQERLQSIRGASSEPPVTS